MRFMLIYRARPVLIMRRTLEVDYQVIKDAYFLPTLAKVGWDYIRLLVPFYRLRNQSFHHSF
jgi:hypothetical protein